MKSTEPELSLKERVNLALANHWKAAVGIFVVIVVLMAGILILDAVRRNRLADSSMMAEDIQDTYTALMQEQPENRDYAELDELIETAMNEYSRYFAAQRALFTKGLIALEQKEWEQAASSFIELAERWPESYLAPVSLFNAGAAFEESGDLDQAAETWQSLVDDYAEVAPDAPEALFNLGRLAETRSSDDEAIDFYKEIESRFPQSRWTNLAKSRILVLESR